MAEKNPAVYLADARMPEHRRLATLVAFTAVFTTRAQDDLIRHNGQSIRHPVQRANQGREDQVLDVRSIPPIRRWPIATIVRDATDRRSARHESYSFLSRQRVPAQRCPTARHPALVSSTGEPERGRCPVPSASRNRLWAVRTRCRYRSGSTRIARTAGQRPA